MLQQRKEIGKSAAFVAVAALALGLGIWLNWPAAPSSEEVGKPLFPAFTDPLNVVSLEIIDGLDRHVKIDRAADESWQLTVVKRDWRYPDIENQQLAKAINAFIGVEKLSIASDQAERHQEFGVVDPSADAEHKQIAEGVGKRCTLRAADGEVLVDLIVGHPVAATAVGQVHSPADAGTLVFVRQPGRDPIYTARLPLDGLSAKFQDWAKGDLLEIQLTAASDAGDEGGVAAPKSQLRTLAVNDYSLDLDEQKSSFVEAPLAVLDADFKKKLQEQAIRPDGVKVDLRAFGRFDDGLVGNDSEATAASDERLPPGWRVTALSTFDAAKNALVRSELDKLETDGPQLRKLYAALTDLKVIDIRPKNPALVAALKAPEEWAKLAEKIEGVNLQSFGGGFYLRPSKAKWEWWIADNKPVYFDVAGLFREVGQATEIAEEGELVVGFDSGVEYVLRLGALDTETTDAVMEKDGDSGKSDDAPAADATLPADDPLADKPAEEPAAVGTEGESDGAAATDDQGKTDAVAASTSTNRYLMVTARFNKNLILPPNLVEVPPEVPGEAPATRTTPAATAPAAAATNPAATSPQAATPTAPAATSATSPPAPAVSPTPAATTPAASTATSSPATAATTPLTPLSPGAPANTESAITTEPMPPPAPVVADADDADDKARANALIHNQRERDLHAERIAIGEKKAAELNAKFAKWYYVISRETFDSLNVDPTTLVRKKPQPAAAEATSGPATSSPAKPKPEVENEPSP